MRNSRKITLVLESEYIAIIDDNAKSLFITRSEYIRRAIIDKMRKDYEWYQRTSQ
jgi:metal-responsive CopG/Arc/MetJ family transcriptional regulator